MAAFSSATLFRIAALLYTVTMPGHIQMGYTTIYPRLETFSVVTAEDVMFRQGSYNCWWAIATFLTVNALLHYKWSKPGAVLSPEEQAIVVFGGLHMLLNGILFWRVGALAAATMLTTGSCTSLLGYFLYLSDR